jgi:TonB family protein
MSESSKQWVGEVVDGKFPLQQYLGGTDHSAVFLTRLSEEAEQKAAIKIVLVEPAKAETQLSRWSTAAQLSHPNLLPVFHAGRCQLGGMDLVYVVTEYAAENLSQILPERALTAEETRQMLDPVLDAIVYLQGKKLVHGHITPANILAIDDKIKLSSDSIFPEGEFWAVTRELDPYDAPEAANSSISAPADVWSLATTLVQTLTQSLPVRQDALKIDPVLPNNLPEPFLEIAKRSLRLEAHRRWSVANVAAYLNPKPAAAAAVASAVAIPAGVVAAAPVAAGVIAAGATATASSAPVSAISVPLSPVTPVPAAKLPPPPKPLPVQPQRPATAQAQQKSGSTLILWGIGAATVAVVLFLLMLPKFFNHRAEAPKATTASAAPSQPAKEEVPSAPVKPEQKSVVAKKEPEKAAAVAPRTPPAASPSSLEPASEKAPLSSSPTPSAIPAHSVSTGRGEVLDQVLPNVSDKARATISGKVRVTVKLEVDAAGNVSQADLDSPGPSKFFADLALQAARHWEFSSPEVNGRSVPSTWLVRFEFSQDGTQAFPKQQTP